MADSRGGEVSGDRQDIHQAQPRQKTVGARIGDIRSERLKGFGIFHVKTVRTRFPEDRAKDGDPEQAPGTAFMRYP